MEFKVGDKVKLRKNLKIGEMYGGLTLRKQMAEFKKGKITSVPTATFNGYHVETSSYFFSEEMLQPRFPWKKFKKGEVIVYCETKEEVKDFLKRAKKHGCVWNDTEKIEGRTMFYRYSFEESSGYDIIHGIIYSRTANLKWSDYMEG